MKKLLIVLIALTSGFASAQSANHQPEEDTAVLNCVATIAVVSVPGTMPPTGRTTGEIPTSPDLAIILRIANDSSTSLHKALASYCKANNNTVP